jgi:predicted amidohydrolase
LSNLDIPVRLVAMPEGALQGFNDEVLDVDHTEFARSCAIDIPGPETDRLGGLGIMMAMEGSYPENGRGLALNGAEVVYRASLPAPFTENDFFEISNRARALENNITSSRPILAAITSTRTAKRQSMPAAVNR